mmetsp:Transcript_15679/g.49331  ORF Transcript_15679/g.49331 Transcript_15679/m.49331 type:complete len:234 (-) Transcript_15679:91-792(-)
MPAEQGGGGGKVLAVVGGAIALGVVVSVACFLARGSAGPAEAKEAVHNDLLHHDEHQRSRLVVMSSPRPTERVHPEEDDHARVHRNQQRHGDDHHAKEHHGKRHHRGHNRTNETHYGHNRTNERHRHGHKHKHCLGGSLAACECMLKCEVFGGDASKCEGHSSNETKQLVDSLILKTMLSHRNMCDGMRCITECAEALGCLDDKVLDDCRIIRKSYAESNSDADPECDLHCSS